MLDGRFLVCLPRLRPPAGGLCWERYGSPLCPLLRLPPGHGSPLLLPDADAGRGARGGWALGSVCCFPPWFPLLPSPYPSPSTSNGGLHPSARPVPFGWGFRAGRPPGSLAERRPSGLQGPPLPGGNGNLQLLWAISQGPWGRSLATSELPYGPSPARSELAGGSSNPGSAGFRCLPAVPVRASTSSVPL